MSNILFKDKDSIVFECPHCKTMCRVEFKHFNCKIFRCGVHKKTRISINPHGSKEYCDNLVKKDLIYGCAKPFRIIVEEKSKEEILKQKIIKELEQKFNKSNKNKKEEKEDIYNYIIEICDYI